MTLPGLVIFFFEMSYYASDICFVSEALRYTPDTNPDT